MDGVESTAPAAAAAASTTAPTPSHEDGEVFKVCFPPDQTFTLTSTMLHHDAPSMFSRVFLSNSGFMESASRKITITDKSPELFSFVIDYLRGYNIFPIHESAIPPRWLPISKLYENLRRDASYYGLLRLETECTRWLKQALNPNEKRAVFRLGFLPFRLERQTPFTPSMYDLILECHLADVHLLRKRFLKVGPSFLTYGPMPWKQIFEQVRNASEGDGVIQSDGSSIVELVAAFVKPTRIDDVDDDRKIEFAKTHISKDLTTLIVEGIRQNVVPNYLPIRFHATDSTCVLKFFNDIPPEFNARRPFPMLGKWVGHGQLNFSSKAQKDGWFTLRTVAMQGFMRTPDPKPPTTILVPLTDSQRTEVEVDDHRLHWADLVEWKRQSETNHFRVAGGDSIPKQLQDDVAFCETVFGSARGIEENNDGAMDFHSTADDFHSIVCCPWPFFWLT
jgi:hypothetical protein